MVPLGYNLPFWNTRTIYVISGSWMNSTSPLPRLPGDFLANISWQALGNLIQQATIWHPQGLRPLEITQLRAYLECHLNTCLVAGAHAMIGTTGFATLSTPQIRVTLKTHVPWKPADHVTGGYQASFLQSPPVHRMWSNYAVLCDMDFLKKYLLRK